jgi:MIP family channel proteins
MGSTLLHKCLAEFIGTFAIVFFGAGSVCASALPGVNLGLLGIGLVFGLTVSMMVSTLGHVSGAHFNPAVTFMAWVTKRVDASLAGAYIVAQVLGGIAAAFILRGAFGAAIGAKVALGTTTVAPTLSVLGGLGVETSLTFFLVLVIFGVAIDGRGSKLGGTAIGAVVCVEVLVGGPLTGASMNPARSLGPALVSGQWANHWIYWVGPLLGAVLLGVLGEGTRELVKAYAGLHLMLYGAILMVAVVFLPHGGMGWLRERWGN